MFAVGRRLLLHAEKPAAGGWTIARHEGQVVLLSGAIPGERVLARVDRIGRGVAYGSTVEMVEGHACRRPVTYDWRCGGNVYAHVEYEHQLRLKSEIVRDAFARIGRLPLATPVIVRASEERGYRMRARLHVRDGLIGFYKETSHELCDPGPTGQLLDSTMVALRTMASRLPTDGARGILAIEMAENVPADERVLHLELDPHRPPDYRGLAALGEFAGVTGLTAGFGAARPRLVYGAPAVTDLMHRLFGTSGGDAVLRRQATSFFQANRFLMSGLVTAVVQAIPPGPVVDLYAGVGLFAVALASSGRHDITAVERDWSSAHDLAHNARPFGSAIRVERRPVEDFLADLATAPTTVIVDPPRIGLSREALARLVTLAPPHLVYVSCDVATLARDTRRLIDTGYCLEHIESFDMFPNTAHIETLAVLVRT